MSRSIVDNFPMILFEQGNDEPIGFIKIICSESIAFADKPSKNTMAESDFSKSESKDKILS